MHILYLSIALILAQTVSASAATLLLSQDFEAPSGFVDTTGRDVSQQTVNSLYGNQPAGFQFANSFTVETLEVNGGTAFGAGYQDPGNVAGNYMIGMLSTVQDDRLGLSFNLGGFDFLNVSIDVTSVDLDGVGGPFIPVSAGNQTLPGTEPTFRFTLFDNPTGTVTIGGGTILDQFDLIGTRSDRNVLDFTTALFGLNGGLSTNGNVTLQIDLLSGGYAGFDNLVITADDQPPPPAIPLPASLPLLSAGIVGLALVRRRRKA